MAAELALENEALLAIYNDEIELVSDEECIYRYTVPQNAELKVILRIKRGLEYPNDLPQIEAIFANADEKRISKLEIALQEKAQELVGSVMIFELLTLAQEWLSDNHIAVWRSLTEPEPTAQSLESTADPISVLIDKPQVTEEDANYENELVNSADRPLLASREIPYRPQIDSVSYSPEELVQLQQEEVAKIAEVLSVPRGVAQMLLNHFKWRSDRVMARYLAYPKETLQEAGLDLSILSKSKSGVANSCELCMTDDLEKDDIVSFETCDHAFCKDCYRSYLAVKIRDEGCSHDITCAAFKCTTLIGQSLVKQLVDKPTYKTYSILLLKNYVNCNSYLRWCPGKYCRSSSIVKSEFLYPNYAKCSCGNAFCFQCGAETHAPATCKMMTDFVAPKLLNEEKSLVWLRTNAKLCPKCKVFIQKNEGCNHMTCRSCRYEFCWVCNGPWTDHTSYYSCNRPKKLKVLVEYDDETKKKMEDSAYFNHHYVRYENHQQSKVFAEKMVKVLFNTIKRFNNPVFEYGLEAATQLVLCRQILSASYAFGFFFPKDKDRDMFDFLQQELEQATESFSQKLEKWFKRPTSTPPSLLVTQTNTSQRLINALIDHAKYDLLASEEVPHHSSKDIVETNLSMIPEMMPPSDDEIKLQQKISSLRMSRDIQISREIEQPVLPQEMTPKEVEEKKPVEAAFIPQEKIIGSTPNLVQKTVLRPPGVVFRRICTNNIMETYDLVPYEGLALIPDIIFVKQKYDVTALITAKKELWMFGNNECGQCGNSIDSDLIRRVPQKVEFPGDEKVAQVDFGEFHTVALMESGNVFAWGQISNGKLGFDISVIDQISTSIQAYARPKPYLVKFPVSNPKPNWRINKVACGRNHTICLDENKKVWGFGSGSFGQMGTGEEGNLDMMVPTLLPQTAKLNVSDMNAGAAFNVINTSDGIYVIGSVPEDDSNAYARCVVKITSETRTFASEYGFAVYSMYRRTLTVFRDQFNPDTISWENTRYGDVLDVAISADKVLIVTELGGLLETKSAKLTSGLHRIVYSTIEGSLIVQVSDPTQPIYLVSGGIGQMSRDFGQAFLTHTATDFSDIKFIVQHAELVQEFHANKIVLAARSERFAKMFAADPQLKEIPVKGVPHREFRTRVLTNPSVFLLYIYSDALFDPSSRSPVNYDVLAKLAARYHFKFLEDQCYYMMGVQGFVSYPTLVKEIPLARKMAQFSDVEILVQDKLFKLHKFILSARSPYFMKMFEPNSAWREGTAKVIELHELESSTFERIIEYIYADTMSWADDGVIEVAEIFMRAHEYCLTPLQSYAEEILLRLINKHTVCQLLSLSGIYNAKKLREKCITFIGSNFTSISKASFVCLSPDDVKEVHRLTRWKI